MIEPLVLFTMDYLLIGAEAASAVMDHLITLCEGMLAPVLEKAGVPESHGLEHATRVAAHVRAAAELMSGISMADVIALEVAALLHDADDSKYFDTSGELTNAQTIVDTLCETVSKEMSDDAAKRFKEICLTAIHLTSTRKHGMDVPDEYKDEVAKRPFLRFVSIADKLDAVGSRGVYRCFAYTVEQCQPIYNKGSPQPQTCDEVHLIASDERLAEYRSRSGNSTRCCKNVCGSTIRCALASVRSARRWTAHSSARTTTMGARGVRRKSFNEHKDHLWRRKEVV